MIKQIVKDVMFLSQKSVDATKEDLYIGQDLLDTLANHREGCVGMAANMIGYLKNIIIIDHDGEDLVMYNPKITKTFGNVYETEEGCLSLEGVRPTKRYHKIKVQWLDASWKVKIKTFEGFSAQIIQHEIDHCNGIII
jgi:peptide deformylase